MTIVYNLEKYEIGTDKISVSHTKRTRESIERLGYKVLENTAEEVEKSALDAYGRYKLPKAN